MYSKKSLVAGLIMVLAVAPVTRAAADGGDVFGGIIGGIIGGAIVNEANKKKTTTTRRVYVAAPNPQRQQNRETQTALNYFGFPSGTPDGVMGRRSQQAVASYQLHMGYPATGQLSTYEQDFLLTSYRRAMAGGAVTNQQIAANPMGPKGLLTVYRDELAGTTTAAAPAVPQAAQPVVEAAAEAPNALPNFMGSSPQLSLASHCNTVSLLTNSNGGFTTLASMSDANVALNEQFCLARTYAIATGEELAAKVQGFTPQQIAQQCDSFGPAMKDYVSALSLNPEDQVLRDVGGFILKSGMSPAQLSGTAKICLSVGYRTDQLDVAIGSALLLTALGEKPYAELLGHHLSQGFGTSKRPDLSLAWYETGLDAAAGGQAVFAPAQPERNDLIRTAAYSVGNAGAASDQPTLLPVFSVDQ